LKKQYHDDGGRGDLTDEQWEKHVAATTKSLDRTASSRAPSHCEWHPLACIVQVPWRDIPAERYGNHRTSSRFYRWRKAGIGNGYGQA